MIKNYSFTGGDDEEESMAISLMQELQNSAIHEMDGYIEAVMCGNNQKTLNKKAVQTLPFPPPTLAEQNEIVSQAEDFFTLAHIQEEKNKSRKKTARPTHPKYPSQSFSR